MDSILVGEMGVIVEAADMQGSIQGGAGEANDPC